MLLTWDQPADSTIIKYQVSRNGGTTFADFPYSSKAANGYNFTGLTNGTEYTFALRAVNADGIGPHATVMATPAAYGGVGLDPATAITADLNYSDLPCGSTIGTITLSSATGGEVTNLRILGTISPPDCWYIAWTTDVVGEIRAWVFAVHLTTTGVNTDNVPLIWRAAPERLSPDTSPDVGLDHYISLTWNRAADSTIGWYEYRQKAGSGVLDPGQSSGPKSTEQAITIIFWTSRVASDTPSSCAPWALESWARRAKRERPCSVPRCLRDSPQNPRKTWWW